MVQGELDGKASQVAYAQAGTESIMSQLVPLRNKVAGVRLFGCLVLAGCGSREHSPRLSAVGMVLAHCQLCLHGASCACI